MKENRMLYGDSDDEEEMLLYGDDKPEESAPVAARPDEDKPSLVPPQNLGLEQGPLEKGILNIAGRSGLFIAVYVYELYHKGEDEKHFIILSLNRLNVVNCRRGFVTVADNGVIWIG